MTSFRLAYLNLSRRKMPTIITIISIGFAVTIAGLLLRFSILSNSRFASLWRGGDAIVGAKAGGIDILLGSLNLEGEYPDFLPYKLFETLRSQQSVHFEDGSTAHQNFVKTIVPLVIFAKLGPFRVVGTDESFFEQPFEGKPKIRDGGRWASNVGEVVVGAKTAEERFLSLGSEVNVAPWVNKEDEFADESLKLKVVGVLEETGTAYDLALFSNLLQARDVFQKHGHSINSIWNENILNYFLIYLSPNGWGELRNLINGRSVGEAVYVLDAKKRLLDLTNTGRTLGFFVVIFTLILGGLSVTSTMVTRFDSMTTQLAVLRAMGFQKKKITHWLLWEGLLIGFSACLLGALLDAILFPFIRDQFGSALPPASLASSPLYYSAPIWIAAMAATCVAVSIPLIRLYRQDVHYLLRGF